MSTFTYDCKKNGQSVSLEIEALPAASLTYVINKGLREYFDNYHAEVTKLGITKQVKGEKTVTPWTEPGQFEATVKEYLTEAYDRMLAGDVASGRRETDPAVAKARKQVAEFAKVAATDDELAQAMAFITKQRQRAGQTQAKAA